jgi:hypothetical protein
MGTIVRALAIAVNSPGGVQRKNIAAIMCDPRPPGGKCKVAGT